MADRSQSLYKHNPKGRVINVTDLPTFGPGPESASNSAPVLNVRDSPWYENAVEQAMEATTGGKKSKRKKRKSSSKKKKSFQERKKKVL